MVVEIRGGRSCLVSACSFSSWLWRSRSDQGPIQGIKARPLRSFVLTCETPLDLADVWPFMGVTMSDGLFASSAPQASNALSSAELKLILDPYEATRTPGKDWPLGTTFDRLVVGTPGASTSIPQASASSLPTRRFRAAHGFSWRLVADLLRSWWPIVARTAAAGFLIYLAARSRAWRTRAWESSK